MSQRYPPNEIIYTKKGEVYSVIAGICLILGALLTVCMVVFDILHKGQAFHICGLSGLFILVLGLIFDNKSMKNATVVFF